jgi:uncharacterized protein (DUF427 family)
MLSCRFGASVNDYPAHLVEVNHVAPVPRRIRAYLNGEKVLDTTGALYVWELPYYPQYYIPVSDVRRDLLIPEGQGQQTGRGVAEVHGLRVGEEHRPRAAKLIAESAIDGLSGTVRFDWGALDAWFEEDEQVFVHPRSPYTRVDALRSDRSVRVELGGVVLADSPSPVMVFETGLPTRYYISRIHVNFEHLIASGTVTACPYKGVTSAYWSARVDGTVHQDLAWAYDFPTRQLLPIAGMIAFYNEMTDTFVDGQRLERPRTHFSRTGDGRQA